MQYNDYKSKYEFTIFNEPFQNELETIEALKKFEALFIMRERTKITKSLISNLPNLKFIMTSGTRNKAIDLDATGITNCELFYIIKNEMDFDKLIWELGDDNNPAWIHISYVKDNVSQEAFTQNRSQEPMLAGDPDKVLMSYR